MVLGLALVVLLSGASLIKGLLALLVGLWLTSIGTDLFTAQARFIFGQAPAARRHRLHGRRDRRVRHRRGPGQHRRRRGKPNAAGAARAAQPAADLGGAEGLPLRLPQRLGRRLPRSACCRAPARTIASFISYGIEKAVSKHPEKFGTGVPEGVAAPEGANNADTGGALVPLLTLGIPGGGTTAILLSALMLWGISPGPLDDAGIARRVLGPGRQHVHRQRHAAGAEPAAGSAVRADAALAGLRPATRSSSASRWSASTA